MNSFKTLSTLEIDRRPFAYHSLKQLELNAGVSLAELPYSTRILIENLLRHEDGEVVRKDDIVQALAGAPQGESNYEIQFTPGRVLLQDFTGVPVVADLAAMRDGSVERGGDPQTVNPLIPVDLVIDHSVQMDVFNEPDASARNHAFEYLRNIERYEFLKWGQGAFKNFHVVPPATGICHQVNLEFLSHVAMVSEQDSRAMIFPDTLVGTDSHTTMINGLGVLGWGVGGIEAEAAMLGQPCTMLIPQVIGVELKGQLKPGVTATDLVLTVTQALRKKGVVGKFVEYFGEGLKFLSIADRATVANMSPEYGATVGIFPVDEKVIEYLIATGRDEKARRAEIYFKAQGLWGGANQSTRFSDRLTIDLGAVEPSMAGPARPQDRVRLKEARASFRKLLLHREKESLATYQRETLEAWAEMSESMKGISFEKAEFHPDRDLGPLGNSWRIESQEGAYNLTHGSIVMAAITSCTNTSNPKLMLGAALLARNAVSKGLRRMPWVKTTFSPGSLTVKDYIDASGLAPSLEKLGFYFTGFGCSACIGNSGPLPPEIQEGIDKKRLATVSVLSGNRNFEARIHPSIMANYLASPPLVVAAAIAGNINIDLGSDPLGQDQNGKDVYLKDIWPDSAELDALVLKHVTQNQFKKVYADVFTGDKKWRGIETGKGMIYDWSDKSTYIKCPPFLSREFSTQPKGIQGARILAVFGDSITTDHISPAGAINANSPAGLYLQSLGVKPADFNSYGSRRGNHEIMMRGTFANVRIRNQIASREGGLTKTFPEGKETTIFEASEHYRAQQVPLVVFAGKEYGSGSSRDWAAKGPRLLGVHAVVAESFERIHRSNLVGMGVLPLQFPEGVTLASLALTGDETIDFGAFENLQPQGELEITIHGKGEERKVKTRVRVDTPNELKYFMSGGILPYVLNRLSAS